MTVAEQAITTEEIPAVPGRNPDMIARELLALTMLGTRVKQRCDSLRAEVRDWSVGTKLVAELPNPDDPRVPYKVGEVRCDGGAVVPRVADQGAFEAWAQDNALDHVVIEKAHCTTAEAPPAYLAGLLGAVFAAAERRCTGPFAEDAASVIWDLLRTSGWTLAPVGRVPDRVYVQPGYVQAVMDMSKAQKEPCAPGGLIPDGVVVDIADPKPYVTATKDSALVEAFVATVALPLPEASALALEGLT